MQPSEKLKPVWVPSSKRESAIPPSEAVGTMDGPYEVFSSDGMNSLRYQKFNTYFFVNRRIDYVCERVALQSNLLDPKRKGQRPRLDEHGDVNAEVFAIAHNIYPDHEQIGISIDFVDDEPEGYTFGRATYDSEGHLHVESTRAADIAFRSNANAAGHFTLNQLPKRINLRETVDAFMAQVNGDNAYLEFVKGEGQKHAVDFGTPVLIPYHTPKYGEAILFSAAPVVTGKILD